jgi:hypothetical protein
MREGVIPALKAARTALTWPCANATLGSSRCRYAVSDKIQQVGQELRNNMIRWLQIC